MSTCKTKQKCSNDYFPVVGDLKIYVRPVSKIIPLFVDTTANSGHFTSSKGRKVHAMKCTKMKKARARATRAKLRTVSECQICKFMLPSNCNSEKMSYHEILKKTNRGFPEPMAKPCYHRKLHQHIRGVYFYFDMNDFDKYIQIWISRSRHQFQWTLQGSNTGNAEAYSWFISPLFDENCIISRPVNFN